MSSRVRIRFKDPSSRYVYKNKRVLDGLRLCPKFSQVWKKRLPAWKKVVEIFTTITPSEWNATGLPLDLKLTCWRVKRKRT